MTLELDRKVVHTKGRKKKRKPFVISSPEKDDGGIRKRKKIVQHPMAFPATRCKVGQKRHKEWKIKRGLKEQVGKSKKRGEKEWELKTKN